MDPFIKRTSLLDRFCNPAAFFILNVLILLMSYISY